MTVTYKVRDILTQTRDWMVEDGQLDMYASEKDIPKFTFCCNNQRMPKQTNKQYQRLSSITSQGNH